MTQTNKELDHAGLAIAVIPARGGSKRVPGKNIRRFFGKPLIAYTIEAARQSEMFDQVIVSTDSDEIAAIARDCGAVVPFLRKESLADDHTPVSAVTLDALNRIDPSGSKYAFVSQLMANCPLRTAEDIRESFWQFANTGTGSQLSVVRYGWQNPWWAMRRSEGFELKPVFENMITQRSQDLPELFCPTGAIWWAKTEILRREATFHIEGRSGWEIAWQHGVDIDTEDDWAMAEALMRMSLNRISANGN